MFYLMHRPLMALLVLSSLTHSQLAQAQDNTQRVSAESGDFVPLLAGDTLAGWHGDNPHTTVKAGAAGKSQAIAAQQAEFAAHWSVENGELINDGHGPYATTDKDYSDIELLVDYRTVPLADSGIYLRGTPQVQIWDTTQEGGKWDRHANRGSGGLFNNLRTSPGQLPLVLADKPFGQWNEFRIVQIGSRTWVELNHKLVVDGAIMENYWDKDRRTPLPATGPIHLQTHGGEIRWRKLAVRQIDSDEAISRLRGDDAKYGFAPLFNGHDLSGWQGAVADYEVVEGAIVCKPDKGGVLFTEEQFDDFVVRLEFKLPAGGNNGLAIRYPGTGRAAYDGMCELQVLDDGAEKYARLDPRQAHGSVYGVAPAHRGYLRPVGQWNYQEVTVKGSTITVELNGTVILDADVSQISKFKDDLAHPGLGLKRGHFGFAGHKDPVMFRNIAIKRLPRATSTTVQQPAASRLPQPIFHASFDATTDANLSKGDGRLLIAESIDRKKLLDAARLEHVSIAKGEGRYGDALRFDAKTKEVVFYEGLECGYQPQDWSGSVSVWLKLDPDQDLEPGFCDPLQITERAWNDAAFFVDFDKELPRDFRLGVFADLKAWNPQDTPWEQIPVAERPMVVVKQPPFSSAQWTHVCFTWSGVNSASGAAATCEFYLNGQHQGAYQRPLKFTWDPQRAAIMLGLNYIGLMDDLLVFPVALTAQQVRQLGEQTVGGVR